MESADLHRDMIVFDGLIVANFGREVFEDMRRGGLTAANCTCCVWEGIRDTMGNVARWKRWFQEHGDLITQVHTTADIARAKREGKTGIALGWQNLSGIEDQIGYLELFKQLGVGIMQIADLLARTGGLESIARELGADPRQVALAASALTPAVLDGLQRCAQGEFGGLMDVVGRLGGSGSP